MAETPRDQLDLPSLSKAHKRAYVMALIAMARFDEIVDPRELELIQKTALTLNARVREADFQSYDIAYVARTLDRPSIQRAAFHDLVALAQVDRQLLPEELELLKYFAGQWDLHLPELEQVDWEQVIAIDVVEAEDRSQQVRREVGQRQKALNATRLPFEWPSALKAGGILVALHVPFYIYLFVAQVGPVATIAPTILALFLAFAAFVAGGTAVQLSVKGTLSEPTAGAALGSLVAQAFPLMWYADAELNVLAILAGCVFSAVFALIGARVVQP